MALVLRKAFLSRNISMLKSLRPRYLSSAILKKPQHLTKRCAVRTFKIETKARLLPSLKRAQRLRKRLASQQEPLKSAILRRHQKSCPLLTSFEPTDRPSFDYQMTLPRMVRSYSAAAKAAAAAAGCPPGPCTPCCGQCLPPPSNCPPKCIQYVTGYYYYPYGFWFCGPYHVTGPQCPCGRGPCPPCLPVPPKCCCLCGACVNPNMAAADQKMAPKPPRSEMPRHRVKSTLSKYFPFQATRAPNASPPFDFAETKKPMLPPAVPNAKLYSTSIDTCVAGQRHCECPNCVREKTLDNACLKLNSRRFIPTRAERDNPSVPVDKFSFESVPKYHSPYPIPEKSFSFQPYEFKKDKK